SCRHYLIFHLTTLDAFALYRVMAATQRVLGVPNEYHSNKEVADKPNPTVWCHSERSEESVRIAISLEVASSLCSE
ncbi:MAG: hypothetical protein ABI670_23250, partial [Chloroflexota bacterium]